MKNFLLISIFWVIWFYGLWFAFNEFSYENAKTLANEYIRNSSVDENWKDKNPHLNWEWKYFYTDSDSPSYVEFKVSCDNNPSCWFIMVNFDWDDVSIPIASTSGNTPSEVLVAKNWDTDNSNSKLYYFNPFEQYAENEVSWNVSSIDPQDDFSDSSSWSLKANSLWKSQEKTKKNKLLKDKVLKAKDEAKKFKKSDEFKKLKKELKDKKQTNWKDDKVSFKYLDMAMAGSSQIINGSTYITWSSTTNCNSRVPCYRQFTYNYSSWSCLSWCSPTAIAMLFWYHDRIGNYPKLIDWTAKDYIIWSTTDINITNMINSIRWYINTVCVNWQWSSTWTNMTQAYKYPVSKWYINTLAYRWTWTPTALMTIIKSEINKWNPIIINTIRHSVTWYWYNNTTGSEFVRVNYWWWNWWYSNIDVNINSIDVNGTYYTISSTIRFDIK